jgi:hypothetical protein
MLTGSRARAREPVNNELPSEDVQIMTEPMNRQTTSSPDVLVQEWFRRARQNQRIHYQCADYYARRSMLLGVPAVVISTTVGSAVFASIEHEASGLIKIALGLLSIVAAVLAGLQTLLSYSERAERHRVTSAKYSSVRRQLELLAAVTDLTTSAAAAKLASVQQALDACADGAPQVPQHVANRVKKELDNPRNISGKQS